MSDTKKECMAYIKHWYMGQQIVTVRLYAGDDMDEYCMQMMVIELLREMVDRGVPEFPEGSPMLDKWVGAELETIMKRHGLHFGFNEEQIDSIKNLAFNYFRDGPTRVHAYPTLQKRLYRIHRQEGRAN